jgi:hypothetical protein
VPIETSLVLAVRQAADLNAWVNTLHPLARKLLLEPESLTHDECSWLAGNADAQKAMSPVRSEFLRRALQTPRVWRAYKKRHGDLARLIELQHEGGVRTKGAPRKHPEGKKTTQDAARVVELERDLAPGWSLVRQKRGRFGGDTAALREALAELRFTPDQQQALLSSRTLGSAAIRALAYETDRDEDSVRTSLRRAIGSNRSGQRRQESRH